MRTHNFKTSGQSICIKGPTLQVCTGPTKLSEGKTRGHGHARCTSHFPGLRPSGGCGEDSYIFHEKSTRLTSKLQTRNLGEGYLSYAATQRSPPCASAPKTSEEGIKDQMKSAESLHMRGTGGTGRLQNTQEQERQFSAAERLMPTQRAVQAAAQTHYLMAVIASPSKPTRQRSRPMLCVRTGGSSRYHSHRFWAQALSDPGARPHTPRARAAPAEPVAHADWPRPEGAGAPPRAGGPRTCPGRRRPRQAARASRAGTRASGLASGLGGHLEFW